MGNRRKTPDLMDDLLSGKKPPTVAPPKPVRQDAGIPVKQQTEPPVAEAKPAPIRETRSKPALKLTYAKEEEEKVKVTFYVSEELQYNLDAAQLQLRRAAPSHVKKQQLSKSAIVEAALVLIIDDLEKEGEGSVLARYLFS